MLTINKPFTVTPIQIDTEEDFERLFLVFGASGMKYGPNRSMFEITRPAFETALITWKKKHSEQLEDLAAIKTDVLRFEIHIEVDIEDHMEIAF